MLSKLKHMKARGQAISSHCCKHSEPLGSTYQRDLLQSLFVRRNGACLPTSRPRKLPKSGSFGHQNKNFLSVFHCLPFRSLVNRLHVNNSSFSVQLPPVNGKDRQNHLPIVVHMYIVHHETTAFYCRYRWISVDIFRFMTCRLTSSCTPAFLGSAARASFSAGRSPPLWAAKAGSWLTPLQCLKLDIPNMLIYKRINVLHPYKKYPTHEQTNAAEFFCRSAEFCRFISICRSAVGPTPISGQMQVWLFQPHPRVDYL